MGNSKFPKSEITNLGSFTQYILVERLCVKYVIYTAPTESSQITQLSPPFYR